MARIIIAEDDDIAGEIARDALTARGHGVGLLDNGADALKVIRSKRPELVVLDCNMPKLNGVLVLREMRQSAELCDTPVLILSGRQSATDVELLMFQGADDYMKKPFDPDEFVFRVEELLARKQVNGLQVRRHKQGFGRFQAR